MLTAGQLREALGGRKMSKEIDALSGHVIVCGLGRVGRLVVAELEKAGQAFVIVDRDLERLGEIADGGYYFVAGDATEDKTLLQAGIQRATTLASVLPNDAANVFITLKRSASRSNPNWWGRTSKSWRRAAAALS